MKRFKDFDWVGLGLAAGAIVAILGMFGAFPRPVDAQVAVATARPTWTCSLDNIGNTLTRCIDNSDSRRAMFLTDLVAQSTTTTGGTFLVRYGTGSNCGTNTVSLLPSAATAVRLSAPANTAAPLVIQFMSAQRIPPGNDLCVLGVATNTFTGQLSGYYE